MNNELEINFDVKKVSPVSDSWIYICTRCGKEVGVSVKGSYSVSGRPLFDELEDILRDHLHFNCNNEFKVI